MSHNYYFNIIPFDPSIIPNPQIPLPIDWEDFQRQLQIICPDGEIETGAADGEKFLYLRIDHEQMGEDWVVAIFDEGYSVFQVSVWPKRLAKAIIFWYRHYIPASYPLYSVIPAYGNVTELTADITLDDIEKLYPFPMSED